MGRAEASARLELEHDFLDNAKAFNWDSIKGQLEMTPDLVNVQPAGRWTALHQAAFEGNKEIAEFLLDKGASVNATTRDGKSPSTVAKGAAKAFLEGRSANAEEEAEDAQAAPATAAARAEPKKKAAAAGEPPKKKAKVAPIGEGYSLNVNNAVDKEYERSSLSEIADAPTSALQGIADKGRETLKKLKVKTVRDLGTWKYYKIAKAIVGLAALEQEGKRSSGAALNINSAMDKKHEKKSLSDICKLPPSALQGLADWVDVEFAALHIKTIQQLGDWKYARWSEWITELADYENLDFRSL